MCRDFAKLHIQIDAGFVGGGGVRDWFCQFR